LKARYPHVFNVALAASEGSRELYVARSAGKSSIYRPNLAFLDQFPKPERFHTVATQQVTATTLDALYARGDLPRIDAVKIDVQGAELDFPRDGRGRFGRRETHFWPAVLVTGRRGLGPVTRQNRNGVVRRGDSPLSTQRADPETNETVAVAG